MCAIIVTFCWFPCLFFSLFFCSWMRYVVNRFVLIYYANKSLWCRWQFDKRKPQRIEQIWNEQRKRKTAERCDGIFIVEFFYRCWIYFKNNNLSKSNHLKGSLAVRYNVQIYQYHGFWCAMQLSSNRFQHCLHCNLCKRNKQYQIVMASVICYSYHLIVSKHPSLWDEAIIEFNRIRLMSTFII